MLLDPGMNLTLRPMRYPAFFEMYKDAIKNTWTVEEVDFSSDLVDLRGKMTPAERHLINRLVAFFATGDSIVGNNLVLNLYKHVNAPEARMYLSRQLYEEALHVEFYLTLLDNYLPDERAREEAFDAINNIPSVKLKADFCFKWISSIEGLDRLDTRGERRQFLLNLICFAACIEGLFFFGAFAYIFFLRSKGLLHGLAAGTNWVMRDESCVPPGTEILTSDGFVKIEELENKPKTLVAQYDLETGTVDFSPANAFVSKDYCGDIVTLKTIKSLHQRVTADHDVVIKSSTTGKCKKIKAIDVGRSSTAMIPAAGYADGRIKSLTDEERFGIAFQADGRQGRGDGSRSGCLPCCFSFSKVRKIKRFQFLLDRLGWEYSERQTEDGMTDFRVKVPLEYSKYVSKDFGWVDLAAVSHSWGRGFIEEAKHWDGHMGERRTCVQYTNTNEEAIDKVQAVAVISGFACSKYCKADDRKETYKDCYNLFIKRRDYVKAHKPKKTVEMYQGKVYCLNMPKGTFFIRQNGKVCVTGNCHMHFAFAVIDAVRKEEPDLFDGGLQDQVKDMLADAIECETAFARDVLHMGVAGLSVADMRKYLEYTVDRRLASLGIPIMYGARNPFAFMDLQDVQELTNFFERRVSAYQTGITGGVTFEEEF